MRISAFVFSRRIKISIRARTSNNIAFHESFENFEDSSGNNTPPGVTHKMSMITADEVSRGGCKKIRLLKCLIFLLLVSTRRNISHILPI